MANVFIISAPSGSGKSTLVARLMQRIPDLHFSISFTTRQPRGKEQNGVDYHFLTRQEFEERIEKGEFLEYAEVFGNYYGTHVSQIQVATDKKCDLLVDIDVQGAALVKEKLPEAVTIFILAPSREVLEKRLKQRGDTSQDLIDKRLQGAAQEVSRFQQYDYILINDDLDDATERLTSIVKAERIRTSRMTPKIQSLLAQFQK
jgi:guanylate kinase